MAGPNVPDPILRFRRWLKTRWQRIHITNDDIRREAKRQGMTRTAVCTQNDIIQLQQAACEFQIGQLPVGKDKNTCH